MTQSNLGDWGVDTPEPEEDEEETQVTESSEGGRSRFEKAMDEAPDNAEPFDDLSCPWCLGPKDDFKTEEVAGERQVSCTNCSAVIPTTADWYLRGEKIAI